VLRYRNLVVKQMTQMKNRVSGLLMETGVTYNKQRLHKVGYFGEMMSTNADINDAVRPLLNLSRGMIRRSSKLEYDLVSSLERDPLLRERLRRLRTVPGVGSITALTGPLRSATTHASVPTGRRSATAACALTRRVRLTR